MRAVYRKKEKDNLPHDPDPDPNKIKLKSDSNTGVSSIVENYSYYLNDGYI